MLSCRFGGLMGSKLPYLPACCEFLGYELVLVMSCLLPASACSISNGQDCYVD